MQNPEVARAGSRRASAASCRLVVRPVTMADKPAIVRISSRIWEGNDYIPLLFDSWVRQGRFWAAEQRGRIIGYAKATELAPGEWWLEGLRVDPSCRRRGIGKELARQVLRRTLDERPVSLRLSTADVNRESMHITETAMGLKPCAHYRFLVGSPKAPRPGAGVVVPQAAEALGFLVRSKELAASRGLLQYAFVFRRVDRRYVAELKRDGHLLGHRVAGRLDGLLVLRPHRFGAHLDISFIAGTDRALAAFRAFISRVARERRAKSISGLAASDEMASALKSVGLRLSHDIGVVYVYEYPIKRAVGRSQKPGARC